MMGYLLSRWWFYGIIAAVSFLLFLFANLPATFVYETLRGRLAPLQLGDISGTLWSGRASQLVYPPVRLESLRWEVNPRDVVRGKPAGLFYVGNSKQFRLRGRLDASDWSRPRLQQVNGDTNIPFLANLFKDFSFQIKGEVEFAFDDFAMRANNFPEITGRVDVTGLEFGPPWKVYLGDIRLNAGMEGDMILVKVNDTRSPLAINMALNLWETGRYRLKGVIEVQAGDNKAAMEEFLRQSMGLVPDNGRFPLNFAGTVPYFR
ncbi:MAG: type II secretion system protein N [Magnetococcales bacterium]|nr:type II secretion system protein N [Magnetococcales bacterium]